MNLRLSCNADMSAGREIGNICNEAVTNIFRGEFFWANPPKSGAVDAIERVVSPG